MGCLKSCSGIPCTGTFPILKIATLFPEFQRQNGQIDSKKHKFSSKPLKKLISGFTPEVIYKIRKSIT
jgi:hypothetical protein